MQIIHLLPKFYSEKLNKALTSTTITCSICSMTKEIKQRITLFMNPYIAKHARAQAVAEDTTLTNLVERALIKYLPKETIIKKTNIE